MPCVIYGVSSSVNKTVSAIMLIWASVSNLKLRNIRFGLGLITHLCSGAVGNLCQCCKVMEPSCCRFCISFQMTSFVSVCGVCHRACSSLCCVFSLNGFPPSGGVFSILFHMWYHVAFSNHAELRQLTEAAPFSVS